MSFLKKMFGGGDRDKQNEPVRRPPGPITPQKKKGEQGANAATPSPSQSNGADTPSMFAGLSVKQSPAHAPPARPHPPQAHQHAQQNRAGTNGAAPPSTPQQLDGAHATSQQPVTSPAPMGGMDLFSGMTLKPAVASEQKQQTQTQPQGEEEEEDGGSLLGMLNAGVDVEDDGAGEEAQSSFAFMNDDDEEEAGEEHGQQTSALPVSSGVGDEPQLDGPELQADTNEPASAFDFLMDDQGDEEEVRVDGHVPADEADVGSTPTASGGMLDFSGMVLKSPAPSSVPPVQNSSAAEEEEEEEPENDEAEPEGGNDQARPHHRHTPSSPPVSTTQHDAMSESISQSKYVMEAKEAQDKSIEEKIKATTATLEEALTRFWEEIQCANAAIQRVKDTEGSSQQELAELQSRVAEFEEKQALAVEEEEYELADELNHKIEAAKKDITEVQTRLDRASYTQTEESNRKLRKTEELLQLVGTMSSKLNILSQNHESNSSKAIGKKADELADHEDRVNADIDRLERALAHITTDLQHVDEEEDGIQKSIYAATKETQHEKEELLESEKRLQAEYEELARLLSEKDEELRVCRQQLDVAESKISNVTQRYDRNLKRVGEKRDRIVTEKSENLEERKALEIEQAQVESKKADLAEHRARAAEVSSMIRRYCKQMASLSTRFSKEEEREREWTEREAAASSELEVLRGQQVTYEMQVEQLFKKVSVLEHDIAVEEQTISASSLAIPRLEADKKLAAKSKAFKKAKQISDEIKELAAKEEAAKEKITSLQDQIAELQSEMESQTANKDTVSAKIDEAEKERDLKLVVVYFERKAYFEARKEFIEAQKGDMSTAVEKEIGALDNSLSIVSKQLSDVLELRGWDSADVLPSEKPTFDELVIVEEPEPEETEQAQDEVTEEETESTEADLVPEAARDVGVEGEEEEENKEVESLITESQVESEEADVEERVQETEEEVTNAEDLVAEAEKDKAEETVAEDAEAQEEVTPVADVHDQPDTEVEAEAEPEVVEEEEEVQDEDNAAEDEEALQKKLDDAKTLIEKVSSLEKRHEELEGQMEEAAEKEDFDLAEELCNDQTAVGEELEATKESIAALGLTEDQLAELSA